MAIYYGDGSNSNTGRVLGQKTSSYSVRTSMNGNPNNQDVDFSQKIDMIDRFFLNASNFYRTKLPLLNT